MNVRVIKTDIFLNKGSEAFIRTTYKSMKWRCHTSHELVHKTDRGTNNGHNKLFLELMPNWDTHPIDRHSLCQTRPSDTIWKHGDLNDSS